MPFTPVLQWIQVTCEISAAHFSGSKMKDIYTLRSHTSICLIWQLSAENMRPAVWGWAGEDLFHVPSKVTGNYPRKEPSKDCGSV